MSGAERQAARLAQKRAAQPPLIQGPPSRQVQRCAARKAVKRAIAMARRKAIAERRSKPERKA